MISSFGKDGVVDLKEGVFFGNRQPIDLIPGSSATTHGRAIRGRSTAIPRLDANHG
jgi:hypothetical protein